FGTLVLTTLPRAIAVREISVAVSPTALLSSAQFILSYFAGLIDAVVDEQPATTSRSAVIGKMAVGVNFILSTLVRRPTFPASEIGAAPSLGQSENLLSSIVAQFLFPRTSPSS
ncbi:hypothetical protein, partial [Mesorhizobium sp.]|uniref:hypothetical protein n=1 Tax=Mesorhizobium sp. TaxID=1871066 RepID=UPI0025BA1E0A